MVRVFDGHHPNPVYLCHISRCLHAHARPEETKGIVAVDLSNDGSDLLQSWNYRWIEYTFANSRHVRGYSVYAVRVHASQISGNETSCDGLGSSLGDPVADENLFGKFMDSISWILLHHLRDVCFIRHHVEAILIPRLDSTGVMVGSGMQ
jgi:hypothetical protein